MHKLAQAGIHPFNPEIFSDDDCLCSAVTDRDLPQEQASTSTSIRLESQLEFSTELEGSSRLEKTVSLQEPENNLNIQNIDHGSLASVSQKHKKYHGYQSDDTSAHP